MHYYKYIYIPARLQPVKWIMLRIAGRSNYYEENVEIITGHTHLTIGPKFEDIS